MTCCSALAPQLLSPVAAFAIFDAEAINKGAVLDISRLFTSLSLLTLLTQPLFELFASIMDFMSAIGCFQRIQQYLVQESRVDCRIRNNQSPHRENMEKEDFQKHCLSENVLEVTSGSFGWTSSTAPVVSDVQFSLGGAKLTMVIGPVACGKSTLLKGVLGEVPISTGKVYTEDGPIAFCDQTPWLTVCVWRKYRRIILNSTSECNYQRQHHWTHWCR